MAQIVSKEETDMSYSISTLMKRNLQDVFGEGDPERRRAAIDEIYTEDVVFYDPSKGVYRGRDEIDRIAGALRATHPDFTYQLIAEPEDWAMVGGSHGYRAALAMRQNTPERISSSPGTAGLPPFISSSTSCPEPGALD
jgi:SnoaL-like domain